MRHSRGAWRAGVLLRLLGAGRSTRIKTVITDSCAQNCRVNILSRRVPEFLIFSRPLVRTGLHFSVSVRRNFVQFRLEIQYLMSRGHSSAGRALAWHARGRRFDPAWLHQICATVERFSWPASPSSRGLGHIPFTDVTGVRIPVGTPLNQYVTELLLRSYENGTKKSRSSARHLCARMTTIGRRWPYIRPIAALNWSQFAVENGIG